MYPETVYRTNSGEYNSGGGFSAGYHILGGIGAIPTKALDDRDSANYNNNGGHLMGYEDKSIQCADCGITFTFSAQEQEFFASKGYTNDPKRCPTCREARKAARGEAGGNRPRRQMFAAVCAQCGKETEVPFEPRQGRPVYCSDCYRTVKPSR
jgi:CxxC-x17-CxxC domain-containing protein